MQPGMHPTSRPARAIAAACIAMVAWLSAIPAPAAALEPPRPLPGYRPAFVTETDEHPWTDCLWASGAMLLDKWTSGEVTRTHQQLRDLAKAHPGGSSLEDLHVAYARLGIDLRFSPDGGERVTWSVLLRRLANGAGAVLLGDDAALPRWYGRWDREFWTLTKDEAGRGQPRGLHRALRPQARPGVAHGPAGGARLEGRVDQRRGAAPLRAGRPVGGALSVAVTPTAKAGSATRVTVASPTISVTSTTLTAASGSRRPARGPFRARTSARLQSLPTTAASRRRRRCR